MINKQVTSITEAVADIHDGATLMIGGFGEAGSPAVWLDDDGAPTELYRRYKRYAQRARETGYPELFYVFELVVRYMEGRPDKEIRELAADAGSLEGPDRANFLAVMAAIATQGYTAVPDSASQRVEDYTKKFLADYGDADPLLDGLRGGLGIEPENSEGAISGGTDNQ